MAGHAPVPADGAAEQPFVADPVQAPSSAVALRDGEDEAEVPRRPGGQEPRFQGYGQLLREALSAEPLDRDRVTIADQLNRLGGGDDLISRRPGGQEIGDRCHRGSLLYWLRTSAAWIVSGGHADGTVNGYRLAI